jgi:hypothetical protein
MKKLLIALITLLLVSCGENQIFGDYETFSQNVTFRVSGRGILNVSQMYGSDYSSIETTACEWTRTFYDGGFYYVAAQSEDGTGCKIQAIVNGEVYKEQSSNGYGVASISCSYK